MALNSPSLQELPTTNKVKCITANSMYTIYLRMIIVNIICICPSYYSPLCNSRIGEYRKGPGLSVCLSVYQSVHLSILAHDGLMDFLHIGYHDQVPWDTDACKIVFYLYTYCSIKSLYTTVTMYHKSLMHIRSKFTLCQNRVN